MSLSSLMSKLPASSLSSLSSASLGSERSTPPLGLRTSFIEIHGRCVSKGGSYDRVEFFADREIVHIPPIVKRVKIAEGSGSFAKPVYIDYTEKRATLQQQAEKGDAAAVAAMLIIDRRPDWSCDVPELRRATAGTHADICRDIRAAGLTPLLTYLTDIEALAECIEEDGAAIVRIDDKELGDHYVVVDRIGPAAVDLRDPFHGWAISVHREAFASRLLFPEDYSIIQIS